MELIDKEALMADMGIAQGCGMSCADCEKINCLTGEIIDRQPTIDAEPVRHGEWKKIQNFAKCSECMHEVNWGSKDFLSPYCPNCGAKMDGGTENETRRD